MPDQTSAESDDPRQARLASVLALAQEGDWEEGHSRHVTALALALFDQLRSLHELGDSARELLLYAGYLHDIGYQVDVRGHHKHSYRLIMAHQWPAFRQWEVQVIAAVARYHRKRLPEAGDTELARLTPERKRLARLLAGILRVADGSDRTHLGLVRRLRARVVGEVLEVALVAGPEAEMELHFAQEKADLLAAELGIPVKARLEPLPEAADAR